MGENHKCFRSCKNNYIGSTNFQVLLHQQEGGYNPLNYASYNWQGITNSLVLLHQQEGGYNPLNSASSNWQGSTNSLNLSEHQLTLAPPCHPEIFICIFHSINLCYWLLHVAATDHIMSLLQITIYISLLLITSCCCYRSLHVTITDHYISLLLITFCCCYRSLHFTVTDHFILLLLITCCCCYCATYLYCIAALPK